MDNLFGLAFEYKLIYIFEIRDESHKDLLKIGDTTIQTDEFIDNLSPNCRILNQAAKKRIKQYTNTAGVSPELLHTEVAIRTVKDKNGEPALKAFRDYHVHRVLENSGIPKKKLKNSTSREWFEVDLQTALKAIEAVKKNQYNLSDSTSDIFTSIIFRPEQQEAIEKTIEQFKSGNRMLWNAKMRFGKTLCALEVVRKSGFKKTIIITHRPVVDSGWYEDFGKIFHGMGNYVYGSKNSGYTVEQLLVLDKSFVYFASMQDLRGSDAVGGKFDKNNAAFSLDWDFIIVDEAHEGTTTALGNEVIKNIVKENNGYETKFLALSGTPFNILRDYEDNIYTWDYIMEQRSKKEWDSEHFGDHNPYDELPELKIYTYDLGKIITDGKYVELEDKAFNFREFFRVWTGDLKSDRIPITLGSKAGDFYHEADVRSFLDLITKEDNTSHYPYSNEEYRKLFRHSLWMVPGVKEAKALSIMLKSHPIFGSGTFEIVNVAGEGDEEEKYEDALKKVRKAIDRAGEDEYTITLSCGRLTTGVTVPEWTAVFMLAGSFSTSAANYLQTIFRVQSPCNINGKIKRCSYIFDFAPDRTLKMVAEAVALSTKVGKANETDKRIMGEFLNYCPVISVEGTVMEKYDTVKLLQQLKRAYAERAVQNGFDDTNLYNDELLRLDAIDIKKFNELKKIIGTSKATPKTKEIDINKQGFTDEEYEEIARIEKKSKKNRTPEEEKKLNRIKEQQKQKANAISILRGISIRIPLLIYGADIDFDEDITMEKLVDIVDDSSWEEFMPSGVTKDKFKDFIKYYDAEIFVAAGRKIRNTVKSADELSPIERVRKIAALFSCFKNPDKETVLTPWRVVNMHMSDCLGGYDFFDEGHNNLLESPRFVDHGQVTKDTLANTNAINLEVNSKTGLYPLYITYSIFRSRCAEYSEDELDDALQMELWNKTVRQNIFVICKTPMAKAITKRTLVGYKKIPVNAYYFDDLINTLKNRPKQFIDRVLHPVYWKEEGVEKMKFDVVVGNPPYQIMDGGNKASASPVYQHFVEQSKRLNSAYISMIMPARWYSGGKGLDEFRNSMLNDKRVSKLIDFFDSTDVFPGVDISGGICYFLWDSQYNDNCNVQLYRNGMKTEMVRPLLEKGNDTFIRFNEAVLILRKISAFNEISFSESVSSRKPFGLSTNPDGIHEKKTGGDVFIYAYPNNGYIQSSCIERNHEWINKYKVCCAKAYGERGTFPYMMLATPFIAEPDSCCSETYLVLDIFDTKEQAENCISYVKCNFFRFLVLLQKNTQDSPKRVYSYVPKQDFSKSWTDTELYAKYGLTKEEIAFIESVIRPMK